MPGTRCAPTASAKRTSTALFDLPADWPGEPFAWLNRRKGLRELDRLAAPTKLTRPHMDIAISMRDDVQSPRWSTASRECHE